MPEDQTFRAFYRAEFRGLWGFAYFLTKDWAEAEELAQDAMVRVYNAWDGIRERDRPALYARTVVVNLHRSVLRRVVRVRKVMPRLVEAHGAPPEPNEDRAWLWEALEACSDKQRQALVLRFYEDLSEAEIATVLGCAPGTVKSYIHRGLARMRARLGADETLTPAGGEA